ncbi:MAG: hypothetical protein ACI9MJ_002269, partial [Alphaproteobacteria bacterium]
MAAHIFFVHLSDSAVQNDLPPIKNHIAVGKIAR